MRALHLGKYFPPVAGGVEYFLQDLLGGLQGLGVDSAALVHLDRRDGMPAPRPPAGARLYTCASHGQWLYAPLAPAYPLRLAAAIRDFRPDVLHLHLPNTSAFWALLVPSARQRPWVIHWHADVVASRLDRRLAWAYGIYRPWERALLSRAQAILATSPDYLASSLALRPWRARCHVVPLGLDPARLPAPAPEARAEAEALWDAGGTATPERPSRVLAIGRLTYYKGHDILIEAVARRPDVQVRIAGGGEGRERLAARIEQLGLAGRVRLTGPLDDTRLHALLATCDLLCLPSLERTEAFGVVQLESMRYGRPVVVSDIPGSGAPWLVREVGHGMLAPPGDPQGLAAAIGRLADDPAFGAALGARGARALTERFAISHVAAAVAGHYAACLAPAVS